MRKVSILALVLIFANSGFSEMNSMEEKVIKLETKVMELEKRVEALEKGKTDVKQPIIKKTPLLKEGVAPIEYKLIQKKFKKAEDKLIERDDKIQFTFSITNNLSKQIDVIYGEMIVKSIKGEEILRKPIKIYKPLDFFSPNKIKPGETFKRTIEIVYDDQLPNLRYLKEAPLSELNVELIFNKVEFSDGSVEFLYEFNHRFISNSY